MLDHLPNGWWERSNEQARRQTPPEERRRSLLARPVKVPRSMPDHPRRHSSRPLRGYCQLGSATQVMLATQFRATVGQKHHPL